MKLYSSYFVAGSSLENERAYSAYMSGPKTYNAIDADWEDSELWEPRNAGENQIVSPGQLAIDVSTPPEDNSPRRRRAGTPVPNAKNIGHVEELV